MSADFFHRTWARRGLAARLLWPASALLLCLVTARRLAYRYGWLHAKRLPVPVLVIGNRIVGGAGKTPTTIALLQHLRQAGWHPGVLSRGYKAAQAQQGGPVRLDAASAPALDASVTGDEPLLIWRRTGVPLMIGPDRVAAGEALLKTHPEIDILVCDDGLQHLKLHRDIEVVVFDERGAGNGWLMPAGPLREPWHVEPASALVAPPVVLYNAARASTPLPGHLARRTLGAPRALADWWAGVDGERLLPPQNGPVAALAGIAQPDRFFDALRGLGFAVTPIPLPDHASFDTLPWPAATPHLIVTEKDAVKLDPARVARARPHTQVWVAGLDFEPEPGFWQALDAALARLPAPPHPH